MANRVLAEGDATSIWGDATPTSPAPYNPHMRPRKAFSLALTLIALALPAVCSAAAPVRRVNAHELVRIAAGSCAGAVQALDRRAGSQDPRYQPLRSVLKSMASTVAEVGARLNARDLGFFKALRTGTRTLAEVHVLLARTGLQEPEILSNIQSLDTAYGRLRNRYGQEWLRFRAGKQLNDEEKRRFAALQAMQALLVVRLQALQEKARAAGDMETAGELGRLATQAKTIAQASPSLDELLNASVAGDAIQGEYAAIRDANPADEPEWNDADQVVTDLSTDESVGFVFVTDLETVQQWSYTGERTNLTAPEEPEPELTDLTDPADPADSIEECTAESATEGCADADLLTVATTAAPPVPSSPPPAPARPTRPLMHGFLL